MVNAIYMALIGIEIQNLSVSFFTRMKKRELQR